MHSKDDCNKLLNAVMPFAEEMLTKHGDFFPFGAKMLLDGEVVSVAAHDGRERPPSNDLIDLLRTKFINEADEGNLLATAIVYDVRVKPSNSEMTVEAIAVSLDHKSNYSVMIFFPYTLKNSKIEVGDPFGNEGDYTIFHSPNLPSV